MVFDTESAVEVRHEDDDIPLGEDDGAGPAAVADDVYRRRPEVVYSPEEDAFIDANLWTEHNQDGYTGIQMFIILHVIELDLFHEIPAEDRLRAIMWTPRVYDEDGNLLGTHRGEVIRFDAYECDEWRGLAFTIECFKRCEKLTCYGPHRRRFARWDFPVVGELGEYQHYTVPYEVSERLFLDVIRDVDPRLHNADVIARRLRREILNLPDEQQDDAAATMVGKLHMYYMRFEQQRPGVINGMDDHVVRVLMGQVH